MSSSVVTIHAKNAPNDPDHSSPNHSRPSPSRWARSSSSSSSLSPSSSFSSSSTVNSPLTPSSPLHAFRIPFSWEHQPGIPKHSSFAPRQYKDLLPLPPAGHPLPKKKSHCSMRSDPFVSALVKCSRDGGREAISDRWKGVNTLRSLSGRFGFIDLSISCKTTCSVVESTAFIPRSSHVAHGLVGRRAG